LALPKVSLQALSSTLVRSISLSPVLCAMMILQATSSSRSLTQPPKHSWKETKWIRDATLKHMTCISRYLKRYCRRHLQSWPMDLLNFKGLSGRIILAFSLLRSRSLNQLWNRRCFLNKINVLSLSFWHSTSHKVLARSLMASLVYHHTKIWTKRSSTTCGHLRITESLTTQWSASVSPLRKWEKLPMLFLEATTPPKS